MTEGEHAMSQIYPHSSQLSGDASAGRVYSPGTASRWSPCHGCRQQASNGVQAGVHDGVHTGSHEGRTTTTRGTFRGCLRGNNLGSKTRKMAQFPGMDMQSVCWILKNGNNGTDLQSPRELARQIQQYFATLKPVFKMPERRPHEPPLHDEDVLALISGHQGFLSKKIGFNGADSKA